MSYGTGQGVLTGVLSRGDELGIGSADLEADARRYIQAGLVSVTSEGFPWPWAQVNNTPLSVLGPVTLGTVTVTNGLTSITFSIAQPDSLAGRKFYLDAEGVVYTISAHTAGTTTATLATAYLGTSAIAQAYHVVQDEYDLVANFLRPLQKPFLRDMHGNCHCELIDEDELKWKYSYPGNIGTPEKVAMIGPKRLIFGPVPSASKLYTYDYLKHPTYGYTGNELQFDGSANDVVIISPPEDGQVLEFYALAHLLNDKNDPRGRTFAEATVVKLADMRTFGLKLRKPRAWIRPGFRVSTPR